MAIVHQGSTSDLLSRIIKPGSVPVTLIIPLLPPQEVIDQAAIITQQHARKFRVVTSLFGACSSVTHRQIDGLLRLGDIGVKAKVSDRGVLPALFVAPPYGCCLLPNDWGWGQAKWQYSVIIEENSADRLFSIADAIWRQSGMYYSARRLSVTLRWLEEIANVTCERDEEKIKSGTVEKEGINLSELTLFDKRRGSRRLPVRKGNQAWWTFHGTSDDRVNPFLPIRIWAAYRGAYKLIRFPAGRRPTGVRHGDDIFFVVLSRQPGGDPDSYIVGHARAIGYRPLIDDATDEEKSEDSYLARFPHALKLEDARFMNGAVGEGISTYDLMKHLGPEVFESTRNNMISKSGNIDPVKSIGQKSIIRLADKGAAETLRMVEDRLNRLGCITGSEIESSAPLLSRF